MSQMPLCHVCGAAFESQRSTARYCSDRCRQTAHRADNAKLLTPAPAAPPETKVVAVPATAEAVTEEIPVTPTVTQAPVSLEDYLREELAITAAQFSDKAHLERSEKYLRWRYAGYLAGEVASL